MRLFLLVCISILAISQAKAEHNPVRLNIHHLVEKTADIALTISADSIHHINCLYPSGYIHVAAAGGVAPYVYQWSNGLTGAVGNNLLAGSYSITVTDALNATAVVGTVITEDYTLPYADAGTAVEVLCTNEAVTLSGAGSVGPQFSYQWLPVTSGNIISGGNTLTPLTDQAGEYELVVTDHTNGCTAAAVVEVKATHQAPVAVVSGGDLNCIYPTIVLQSSYTTTNTAFNWQGPGGFTSALPEPVVSAPGNYIFTITDTLTTCGAQAIAVVTSGPQATASGGGVVTCSHPSLTLSGAGTPTGISYKWTGPGGYSSTIQNPTVTVAGTYTLIVTQPVTGCTATSTVQVTANTLPPTVTAGSNGVLTCINTSSTLYANAGNGGSVFQWSGPNGFNSSNSSQPVTVPGTYQLTVTNPNNGCTATSTASVVASTTPPGVTATGGALSCTVLTTTLHSSSAVPGVSYSWKGPSNFTSTSANPVVNNGGTYTVSVTNPGNGCISTATVSVTQNVVPPSLNTTTGAVNCNVPSIKITATSTTPGLTYSWAGPAGFTATVFNPSVTAGGIYTVTITNPVNGCTNSNNVYVTENKIAPIVFAGTDRSLNCVFTSILMNPFGTSSGAGYTYQWTTTEGNIISGATTLYARADAPGTYVLTVKNTQNGCTTSDEMQITQSDPVTASASELSAVTCHGMATGSAKATGSGVGLLKYSWSNGTTTANAVNLTAGFYTVTITDEEGCSATASTSIFEPAALTASVSTTAQTIAGVNNGSASASGTGGTFPYTFKWSTGAVQMNINNLAPGSYTVTITDLNGCTKVQTGTVNSVSCAVVGNITATQISCSGAANGTATANLTGAAGTIQYVWSHGASTKTVSNLNPGTYTVTATDNNGCSIVLNTQITSPSVLVFNIASQTNVVCQGQQNGAITVSTSGGTAPYTYLWSNGANGLTTSNLAPGVYTCTVTDTKGCTMKKNTQILLTDQNPPQLALKNATVNLGNNGIASLTPALFDNGSVDLECAISSWTVSPTSFDCEQIGTYTVTLTATDQNGNTATGTASVTIKDNITPTLTCPANRTVAACASNVTYTLPQVTDNCQVFSAAILTGGLASGASFPVGTTVQTFSFTDYGSNTATCSFTVTVQSAFDAAATTTPASCSAACDGTASVNVSGQSGNINFVWSNGQNSAVITGLCQGNYTVTVTDGAGCSQLYLANVSAASGSAAYSVGVNVTPANCSGSCDGQVSLIVSGGNSAPNVFWSNGLSGTAINGLCPGSYEAVLTDASGCSQTQQVDISTLDQQAPSMTCPANIAGSVCQSTIIFDTPQVTDNCVVDMQQLQQTSGLPSGSSFPVGATVQMFRYTDTGGNAATCVFTVQISPAATVSVMATPATCAGMCNGTAAVSVNSGQGPFVINWSNGGNGPTLNNLCAGVYTATISDGMGCSQTQTLTVTQPAALTIAADQVVNDATGTGTGYIAVTVSGGVAPYTYTWKRNGLFFAATEDINGLTAGQYTLSVTDGQGCAVASTSFTIQAPVVATGEPVSGLQMVVYPNPATTDVFIRLEGLVVTETLQIQVLDIQGRILREALHQPSGNDVVKMAIDDLPNGMLVIRLMDGQRVVSKLIRKM